MFPWISISTSLSISIQISFSCFPWIALHIWSFSLYRHSIFINMFPGTVSLLLSDNPQQICQQFLLELCPTKHVVHVSGKSLFYNNCGWHCPKCLKLHRRIYDRCMSCIKYARREETCLVSLLVKHWGHMIGCQRQKRSIRVKVVFVCTGSEHCWVRPSIMLTGAGIHKFLRQCSAKGKGCLTARWKYAHYGVHLNEYWLDFFMRLIYFFFFLLSLVHSRALQTGSMLTAVYYK